MQELAIKTCRTGHILADQIPKTASLWNGRPFNAVPEEIKSVRRIEPEGRRNARTPVPRIVLYKHQGRRLLTITTDLSPGGMRIRTHWPLPEGESLNFKLVLGADSIWLKAKVVYNAILPEKKSVSGIQFVDTSSKNHAVLQEYLSTLERWPKRGGAFL